MRKKVHIYFLFVFVIAFLCAFQSDKNVLLWQQGKLLTWDDFNGKPEKRFAAASTHYDILQTVSEANQKPITVKVEAVFFRHKSWKNKNWINESVLVHEQKHFDIVELYARKLRKAISETKVKNHVDLITKTDELYKIYDKEMDVYQDKYDDETDGSMNGDKQREWMKKIMKEIADLDKYKGTVIEILFN